MIEINKIYNESCLETMARMPDNFINCIVTSPPYWALRDYGLEPIIWDNVNGCVHEWKLDIQKPKGGKGSIAANVGANKNDFANIRDHDIVSAFCLKCGAWRGSLGLEPDFRLYIRHLIQIFEKVKRVLRDD